MGAKNLIHAHQQDFPICTSNVERRRVDGNGAAPSQTQGEEIVPILVNGSVDVSPRAGDLHVDLVDKPVTADPVATWLGRIYQQRREPLDPPKQGHVVDLDTPLGEELLEITVGQSVTQVPAHGNQDDVGWEPESSERRLRRLDWSNEVSALHSDSLACQRSRHEPSCDRAGSRPMQQCPARSTFRFHAGGSVEEFVYLGPQWVTS